MIKPLFFKRMLFAPAMLLLCGVFLQSCTEEMPMLNSSSAATSSSVSSNSNIVLKYQNNSYKLTDKLPGFVGLASVSASVGTKSVTKFSLFGVDNAQTNALSYTATFQQDTVTANKYIFQTSQLNFNNKLYSTINASGKAIFKIDKINATDNTTSGSFSYYVYDDLTNPKDSIYISGTFNVY